MNGFYDGEEPKKACCGARKIKPLNAALLGADAWITGQRREQSTTRIELNLEELDDARGIAKFNPLFDWTEADIWAYIKEENVPIHPLHLKGYPSIGCEPCTRQVKKGEDIRAGPDVFKRGHSQRIHQLHGGPKPEQGVNDAGQTLSTSHFVNNSRF